MKRLLLLLLLLPGVALAQTTHHAPVSTGDTTPHCGTDTFDASGVIYYAPTDQWIIVTDFGTAQVYGSDCSLDATTSGFNCSGSGDHEGITRVSTTSDKAIVFSENGVGMCIVDIPSILDGGAVTVDVDFDYSTAPCSGDWPTSGEGGTFVLDPDVAVGSGGTECRYDGFAVAADQGAGHWYEYCIDPVADTITCLERHAKPNCNGGNETAGLWYDFDNGWLYNLSDANNAYCILDPLDFPSGYFTTVLDPNTGGGRNNTFEGLAAGNGQFAYVDDGTGGTNDAFNGLWLFTDAARCAVTETGASVNLSTSTPAGAANSITEASGAVISQYDNDIIYTLDDNGSESWIYAVGRQTGNLLAAFDVDQPEAGRDIEDITYGPGPEPGENYVYLGDHGGNSALCGPAETCRPFYIWRVKEQDMIDEYLAATGQVFAGNRPDNEGGTIFMAGAQTQRLKLKMPTDLNGANSYNQDVESMFIDPSSDGDLYFITKRTFNPQKLLRVTAAEAASAWGRLGGDAEITLTHVADTAVSSSNPGAVAADHSSDSRIIGVATEQGGSHHAKFFVRDPGETVAQAMASGGCDTNRVIASGLRESLGFSGVNGDFITLHEGSGREIREYSVTDLCGDNIRHVISFEACDGTDLIGLTCSDIEGFTGSGLACLSDCTGFDTSACTADTADGIRHVATTGTDTGDCEDVGAPCETIQYCIDQMNDGDTCQIEDGTYTEITGITHIDIDAPVNCTTLGCTITATNVNDPPTVIMDSGANPQFGFIIDGVNNVTISGIEFVADWVGDIIGADDITIDQCLHTYETSSEVALLQVRSGSDRFTWQDSTVYPDVFACDFVDANNPKTFAITGGSAHVLQRNFFNAGQMGDIDGAVAGLTISRNVFEHVSEHGLTMTDDDGGTAPATILVENNVFKGEVDCDAQCDDIKSACNVVGNRVIDLYDVNGLIVRNNTVVGHDYGFQSFIHTYKEPAQCGNEPCARTNVKIYNNAIVDMADWSNTYLFWIDASLTCNGGADDGEACATDATCDDSDCNGAVHTGPYFSDGNYYEDNFDGWPKTWGALRPTDNDNTNNCGVNGDDSGQPTSTFADWNGCDAWTADANHDPASIYQSTYGPTSLFTDYAGEDYSLKSGSALINAGVEGTDGDGDARCATEDFLGNTRTDGNCDIGAFEFFGGAVGARRVIVVSTQ